MFRLICSGSFILLLLSGCSMDGTPTRLNDFTPLTSIEIVADAPKIAAGTSTELTVNGNFSGQFSRDITAQAVWSSSAPAVAGFITPEKPNRVTGHGPGTAILTATVGSLSTDFILTVTTATVTELTISPAAPEITTGQSRQFTASGTFSDGSTQDLTFDAGWISSAPAVATVSDAAASKGLAQALTVGTTAIIANFGGKSDTTLLTVTAATLQSITVSPLNPTLLSQSARNFQAIGHYSDGSTAEITARAVWTSSRPEVASIASGGAVKTTVQGTTAISAGLDGISGTSSLKVTGGNLTGIVLSPANPRLVRDTSAPLTATGSFSNGSSRDITGVIDWSVANPSIAAVTIPGNNQAMLNALAVTAAPTRVTAKSGLVTTDINLTVTAPLLQSLTISPAALDLIVGTSDRFTATAAFNDGSTQDVTADTGWTSSDAATAAVDNSPPDRGRVRGVAASNGSVEISAAFGALTVKKPVTVKARTIASLTIAGTAAAAVGNQVRFTAKAAYTDGSVRDVTGDANWSSDNPNVASLVDNQQQPGQLVAVDKGTATITAAFDGKTQTRLLTVN